MPRLTDVENLLRILGKLGVEHHWTEDGALELEAVDKTIYIAPYDLVRTMRASFVVLGPLWARRGVARVSYPGGCVFGHRPVDLHLKGLRDLGGMIEMTDGYVTISGPPLGGPVFLGGNMGSTVLGTANVLMAATLAKGTTYLESAAMEPEIEDLCNFLNACGARISGIGSHLLVIEGVETLTGCEWTMIPDRIEAGTFLCGAIMMNSDVIVQDCNPMHLLAVVDRRRLHATAMAVGAVRSASGRVSVTRSALPSSRSTISNSTLEDSSPSPAHQTVRRRPGSATSTHPVRGPSSRSVTARSPPGSRSTRRSSPSQSDSVSSRHTSAGSASSSISRSTS